LPEADAPQAPLWLRELERTELPPLNARWCARGGIICRVIQFHRHQE